MVIHMLQDLLQSKLEHIFFTFSQFPFLHRYSYPNDFNKCVHELPIKF